MESFIGKLKEHLEAFPDLTSLMTEQTNHAVEYEMNGGIAIGVGLIKTKHLAIQRVAMPKGAMFQEHMHSAPITEVIYIESGCFDLEFQMPDGNWIQKQRSTGDVPLDASTGIHDKSLL